MTRIIATFLVTVLLTGISYAQTPDIWHVNPSTTNPCMVTDGSCGMSWDNAFLTIEDALSAASDLNDPRDEIWVKAGTYKPASATATFQLKARVAMYGGFAGNENELDDRILASNETILSGELGSPTVFSDNVEIIVTAPDDPFDQNNDNYLLSDFTITRAKGHGIYVPPPNAEGAFQNLKIIDNRAVGFAGDGFPFGAGMFLENSDSTITNCKFIDNYLDANGGGEGGGAGLALFASDAAIENCMFDSNTALSTESLIQGGGGAYSSGGLPVFRRCDFKNNTVKDAVGGGLYLFSIASTSEPEPEDFAYVAGCTFTDNTAETLGNTPNLIVGGGGAWSLHQTQYLSCTFRRNRVIDIDGDPFIPDDDNLPFGIGGGANSLHLSN